MCGIETDGHVSVSAATFLDGATITGSRCGIADRSGSQLRYLCKVYSFALVGALA